MPRHLPYCDDAHAPSVGRDAEGIGHLLPRKAHARPVPSRPSPGARTADGCGRRQPPGAGPRPRPTARGPRVPEICVRLLRTARWCVLAALERQDPAKTTRTVFAVSVAETPSHETLGASRTDLRVMDNRIRPREPTLHDALACSPESLRSLCRLYAHRRAHRRATIFRTEGLPKTSYPGAIIPDCG